MSLEAEAVNVIGNAFLRLEGALAPSQQLPHRDSFVSRDGNKGIHEALIQKLARNVSGLNAVAVLLAGGYVQEAEALYGSLDEIQRDIFLLATKQPNGARTKRQNKYRGPLREEAVNSLTERERALAKLNLVSGKGIHARTAGPLDAGSQALADKERTESAQLSNSHAGSESGNDTYCENPRCSSVGGIGSPPSDRSGNDGENHVYLGLLATVAVAKAFGDQPLVQGLCTFLALYETTNVCRPLQS